MVGGNAADVTSSPFTSQIFVQPIRPAPPIPRPYYSVQVGEQVIVKAVHKSKRNSADDRIIEQVSPTAVEHAAYLLNRVAHMLDRVLVHGAPILFEGLEEVASKIELNIRARSDVLQRYVEVDDEAEAADLGRKMNDMTAFVHEVLSSYANEKCYGSCVVFADL
ncbi:uncharacterized protein CC84DRAFT_1205877 [Paraphaeosphaeria sporulosa]|uniref:Uncharacterized protein n=1 Tax=Paraphaeosphaeria sporulosa TaxID=1460663 RepID=A0A177CG90_9PLEO|nr:uncharacterized protein CC84DRAFT_1205877 [Paraphaeosphaeria sporulosa]OAG06366.1 hypothetical protein CC84DRAFT_1205877 [Paraphaeosphaeria sporulosa]